MTKIAAASTVEQLRGRGRRGWPAGRVVRAAAVYGALLVLTAFILLPLGWMVTAALKPDTAIVFDFPPEFFPTRYFEWDTFAKALFDEDEPYARFILNTAFLILVNMVFAVISNSLIAYAFARLRFRGPRPAVRRCHRDDAAACASPTDPAVPALLPDRLV